MKTTRSGVLAAILATALATQLSAAELQENVDRSFSLRPGGTVSVSNVNGSIKIASWDRPEVSVHAVKKVRYGLDEDSAREALRSIVVEMRQSGNHLTIETKLPRGGGILDRLLGGGADANVAFVITVPRQSNLNVRTVNGAVRIAEVVGRIEIGTTNGAVEIERAGGNVNAETTNGSIRVQLVELGSEAMHFETTNGSVTISVPESLHARVDFSTTNGSISSDFPLVAEKLSKREVRGTINGGGPSLTVETTNGSIRLRKIEM